MTTSRTRLPLSPEATEQMLWHAQRDSPAEACGFVMEVPDIGMIAVQCRNVHSRPNHYFEVHPEDLEQVYDNEEWIVGMYHSHPSGPPQPSPADYKYAPEGIRYFLVCDGKVTEWDLVNKKEIV